MANYQLCSRCKIKKQLSEFGKNRNGRNGINYWCKECCKKERVKNREYCKQYQQSHPRSYFRKCIECGKVQKLSGFPRSNICRVCSLRGKSHRLGTGQGWHKGGRGYIIGSFNRERHYQHRYIMEKQLGRKLLPNEVVHHRNGDKIDNRKENLELMTSRSAHLRIYYDLHNKRGAYAN